MKITFNSPVILIYTLIACLVQGLSDTIWPGFNNHYFTAFGQFDWSNVGDYFRMVSHIAGHANWEHLVGNFSFILLIGPILEEKYGSKKLLLMILVTAAATGILNALLWDTGIVGASGIVFMMILLGSLVNFRAGTIPMTFILIVALYLGREVYNALSADDNISQFGHIMGGILGSVFGFVLGTGHKAAKTG